MHAWCEKMTMRLAAGGTVFTPRASTSGNYSIHDPPTITTTNRNIHESINWKSLKHEASKIILTSSSSSLMSSKIGRKWKEYQGVNNWEGLLDPLDDKLRNEILRYGNFVEATYRSFDFEPSSPTYSRSKFSKKSLLKRSGFPTSGYRVTRNLTVTSGIDQLPSWVEHRVPSWLTTRSSWVGYAAVCQDKDEICRLGRRDVVIALRGTATCFEWLGNLQAGLTPWPAADDDEDQHGAMVESGFLSLYTSGGAASLQSMIRDEMENVLEQYAGERLSVTVTGHSLGAALATLAAYDINTTFRHAPMVTVVSFGGPRLGNREFRRQLDKNGPRVLRIVNSNDVITKLPGFVIDGRKEETAVTELLRWVGLGHTRWGYADVGRELRVSSKDSPYVNDKNVATCHELSTYLHLIDGFVSSTCPFKETARMMMGVAGKRKLPFQHSFF